MPKTNIRSILQDIRQREVVVQWLNRVLDLEASASLIVACLNSLYFSAYAAASRTLARRAAAVALASVSLAFGLEALLFLAVSSQAQSSVPGLALLAVRTLLLVAGSMLAALVLRACWRRRT